MAGSLGRELIEHPPGDGRLVRVHDHLWLRLWIRGGSDAHPVRAMLCSPCVAMDKQIQRNECIA